MEPDPTEVSAGATPPAVTARRASADIVVQLLARGVMLLLGVVTTLVVIRTLGDERFGHEFDSHGVRGVGLALRCRGLGRSGDRRSGLVRRG